MSAALKQTHPSNKLSPVMAADQMGHSAKEPAEWQPTSTAANYGRNSQRPLSLQLSPGQIVTSRVTSFQTVEISKAEEP